MFDNIRMMAVYWFVGMIIWIAPRTPQGDIWLDALDYALDADIDINDK